MCFDRRGRESDRKRSGGTGKGERERGIGGRCGKEMRR